MIRKFNGHDLAKVRPGEVHPGIREVLCGFGEEVRANDETCVDDSEVVEFCILEDEGADNGKVDVGRGELTSKMVGKGNTGLMYVFFGQVCQELTPRLTRNLRQELWLDSQEK